MNKCFTDEPCPIPHDHDPANDAAQIGYNFMNVRKGIAKGARHHPYKKAVVAAVAE